MGNFYFYKGDNSKAIESFQQALQISQGAEIPDVEYTTLIGIGNCFTRLGQIPRAIDYLEKALTIVQSLHVKRAEASILGNLGVAYSNVGNLERAFLYHQKQLDFAQELGDKKYEGDALGNIGKIYAQKGEINLATDYLQKALKINREIGHPFGEVIEIELMRPGQVIVSPIHLPLLNAEYIHKLLQKRVVALAMEYIRDDVSGAFPVVHAMSEISGNSAILIAADLLATTRGGKGVLLGGVAGVPPAKVIILGAGVIAEFATCTALGLGAEVRIFDNNIQQIIHLQNQVGRPLHTSVINPKHLQEQLLTADVAIGAVHSAHANAPMLLSEDIVRRMKPGSVRVDVSIDQGGGCARWRCR